MEKNSKSRAKNEFKKSNKTMTGQKTDSILMHPDIKDIKETVVVFGRFNPPTIGHQKLIREALMLAITNECDLRIYLSHSEDMDNPIPYDDKLDMMRELVNEFVRESDAKNLLEALQECYTDGFESVIILAGEDRLQEYQNRIEKYNGELDESSGNLYNFGNISFHSAGSRQPLSEEIEGVSASKVREGIREGLDMSHLIPQKILQHYDYIVERIQRADKTVHKYTKPDGTMAWRKQGIRSTKSRKKELDLNLVDESVTVNLKAALEKELKKRHRKIAQYKAIEDDG